MDYEDQEMQEFYMEQLKDNYQNPVNKGTIDDYTFLKQFKNPTCGDMFTIYVKLSEDNSKILDVKYEGDGCAISTASISLLSQKLINMNFVDAKQLIDKDVYEMLGVRISPGRVNCAMLSINCFKAGASEFDKSN